MRYIDDLLTLNNSRFECAIDDIYPPELQLKKSYGMSNITVTNDNGKYSTAVYDKKDSMTLKKFARCVLCAFVYQGRKIGGG